jgi:Ni,Fe-hydrogenase III large subunit
VDPAIAALSRAKIKEVVSTSFPELKNCYGQALMRDHSATGNVTFEFVIGQAGKVARAQVRDATLPDCSAIQCMLAELRDLEFPAPVGRSLRIIYPIRYVVEQEPVSLR